MLLIPLSEITSRLAHQWTQLRVLIQNWITSLCDALPNQFSLFLSLSLWFFAIDLKINLAQTDASIIVYVLDTNKNVWERRVGVLRLHYYYVYSGQSLPHSTACPAIWCGKDDINPYSAGIDFRSTLESDVCRRQILTSEVNPRTWEIYIFIIAVYP